MSWDDGGVSAGLNRLSAVETASRIRSGEISSSELVRACLDRIEEREPFVRAWKFLDPALALAQAMRCDTSEPRGPLHGVSVGLKDQFDTADMLTGYGSPIYEGYRPVADPETVTRLRVAGAILLGKNKLTEFTTFIRRTPPTR
jgi:Asp-tRNA(Asn)/Glu-tRNA(Gln) amidotransferase A subunit family amidase